MNLPTVFDNQAVSNQDDSQQPEAVIRLENVSVNYRVPFNQNITLKEYAIRWMQRKVQIRTVGALKNVSLTVYAGEVFGVIGRNGAGKSTLLKLVAGVLRRPTSGRAWVKGRVAPLLQVGAGFHPDLSGHENVFLNGALPGLVPVGGD